MKKIAAILAMALLISFTSNPNEEKEITGKLTISEWQILVSAVNTPDDVTANQKKVVLGKLIPQLNQQIQDTTKKK